MEPIEIKRINDNKIQINWLDGFSSIVTLKDLRDNCPCASCQGEQVGLKKFEPVKLEIHNPAKYKLKSIEPIGNYAIKITWGDGHDTGIYSFEHLRFIMEKFAIK